MSLIDSHCHLDFTQFADDYQQVVADAQRVGVKDFVIPGVQASQWQKLISFCQGVAGCHYGLGLHPYFLETYQPQDLAILDQLLSTSNAIAVGECGIDVMVDDIELQQAVFEAQIQLANKHKLPMILHHRKSHHLIFQSFKKVKPEYGGAIHAFSGSVQDANKYIDLGFKLGIGGTITYPRANKTRQVIEQVPVEALLLETDSPDMPLNGKQGQRNEPKYLPLVLACLAELKQQPADMLAAQIEYNTRSLFNL